MCFNSKVIVREVQRRSALMGKAIQAGVDQLQQRKRPELFAGVIAGWETMIGQDFETGKYLGFRALLNRGFTRDHPPADMDLEREKVVQEFVELWAKGFADAGISTQKIYSHTAPHPRRAFQSGGNNGTTYSEHNHFATIGVAFGKYHQPGFSTYPVPFLFDDIYEELDKHKQVAWASSEGTNLQLGAGPGQSGMTMETYLAKMFNHGATLVNVYSWGIGGEANKNMSFRVVTEGEEALGAYRKFLKGDPLIEGQITLTLMERLPPKIHKIQEGFPAWMQKSGNKEGAALMQKMQEQLKGKNFEEAEKTADSILQMMGVSGQAATEGIPNQNGPVVASERVAAGSAGAGPLAEDTHNRLVEKIERVRLGTEKWAHSGRDTSAIAMMMKEKVKPLLDAGEFMEAEVELDHVLEQLQQDEKGAESPADPAETLHQRVAAKVELVTMGAEKWAESGRDLSAIQQIMEEKVKPLLDTGKFMEAEVELDRVLDRLKQDGKSAESPSHAEAVQQPVPEEARQHMRHKLDSSYVVFRDKVQEELKLTKEQKEKLEVVLPDAMQFFQKINGLSPEEQEKELKAYRPRARERLAAVLQETLNEGQRTRLHQIELQRDLLTRADVWKELQVTDEQQKQFMVLIQETQNKINALMEEIRKGGNIGEVQPKVLKSRADLEDRLEALLTDAQKKQWKEMLGKPMDISDIFDGVLSR
jgi:hypothetical protein